MGGRRCEMLWLPLRVPHFLSFLPSFLSSSPSSFLPSFLPPFLPPFLPSFLRCFLPSFLPPCLPLLLHFFLPSFLPFFLPFFLPSFVASFLPSSLSSSPSSFLPSFLPPFLPSFLRCFLPSFLPSCFNPRNRNAEKKSQNWGGKNSQQKWDPNQKCQATFVKVMCVKITLDLSSIFIEKHLAMQYQCAPFHLIQFTSATWKLSRSLKKSWKAQVDLELHLNVSAGSNIWRVPTYALGVLKHHCLGLPCSMCESSNNQAPYWYLYETCYET